MAFKMGHGGTLDPLATGVLIVGIGRGTKHLGEFLGCTKTYETVVLFGKSTDTYDVAGKVVAEAPFDHVTRTLIEEKISQFRGKIKQVPPVYSALRINGMKAYEYARLGKELPRELESRDMEVSECELVVWYDGGQHEYRWPAEEASSEDKLAASKFLKATTDGAQSKNTQPPPQEPLQPAEPEPQPHPPSPSDQPQAPASPTDRAAQKAAQHTHALGPLSPTPSPAPAALIRLTVSSGFYVRSFAHDLGLACNSLAIMTSLIRSRQGDYIIPTFHPPPSSPSPPGPTTDPSNAPPTRSPAPAPAALIKTLTYPDLHAGEEEADDKGGGIVGGGWAAKLRPILSAWVASHPAPPSGQAPATERYDSRRGGRHGGSGGGPGYRGSGGSRDTRPGTYGGEARRDDDTHAGRRRRGPRNSSSPDE